MEPDLDILFARSARAIAETKRLTVERLRLLDEMAGLYEQRLLLAMKASCGVQETERALGERYRRLATS